MEDISRIIGPQRPHKGPKVARRRFTPSPEAEAFLKECEERGYDISTIINLALSNFKPVTKPDGITWEGVDAVLGRIFGD